MELPNFKYEIKYSQTNQLVPVVNGNSLHDLYNPTKEAKKLVQASIETLTSGKRNIIILGLGFGYHIVEIQNELLSRGLTDVKITIVEPFERIIKDAIDLKSFSMINVEIFNESDVNKLYADANFREILSNKPAFFAHPPSLSLHRQYFMDLMSFRTENTIESGLEQIRNEHVSYYFEKNITHETLRKWNNHVAQKEEWEELDFLCLAANEILNTTTTGCDQ